MTEQKPNILMIMADQLSPRFLPMFHEAGKAKVPHLAELANESVIFENCYCNSPLCAPSRACFYTGQKITTNKAYGNAAEFYASIPTFMHYLRMEGYRTVLSGKAHFVGPDQLHGFEKRLTTDIYPSTFLWSADWEKGVQHGPGTSVQKLQISGVCKTNNQILYDEEVHFRALEFLRYEAMEPKESPFFLQVSYTHPHEAFQVTQKYWDMYTEEEVGYPIVPARPLEEHHPYNQWLQKHHGVVDYPPTDRIIMDSRRAHFGMITYLDEFVGQLIGELKRLNLYDNTIVMFTSDHGDMLGEHGMWFKRTFFDGSVKIPLMISWPGTLPHRLVEDVVSSIDLFPTMLDMIGYNEIPQLEERIDGYSLSGLLTGNSDGWKNEAVVEYLGGGVINPMLMVRKDQWKYVYVHEHTPLLFDLQNDPHEVNDLSKLPQYAEKMKELHQIAVGEIDVAALKENVIREQRERLIVHHAQTCGEPVSWDYQPMFDASQQYVRGGNLPSFI